MIKYTLTESFYLAKIINMMKNYNRLFNCAVDKLMIKLSGMCRSKASKKG